MKSRFSLATPVLAFALIVVPAVHAQEKAAVVVAGTVEAIVTVVDVDRQARVVTVKGPKGGLVTINVPPEAQNLDQVQPGARFKVEYLQSVVLALSKGTGTATSSESKHVRLAKKGANPGGTIVSTREISAVVEKIDRENRMVTVRGPERGSLDLEVDPAVKAFDQIKPGDTITVQYTEGLAMHMIPQ